jgi:hypothetical protein
LESKLATIIPLSDTPFIPINGRMLTGSLPAPGEHVILAAPALGDDSTLLGAAEAAFAPLLDDPLGAVVSGARGRRPAVTA